MSIEYIFKSHIFVAELVKDEELTELEWHQEVSCGKLKDQSYIVDAEFALSDYTRSRNDCTFEVVEFSDKY